VKTNPHLLLTLHLRALNVELPTHEWRFHEKRKWRFDLCWPRLHLAVEVHGGVWTNGRHTRGKGFTADREKVNAAVELGWVVFEYTTEQIESGAAARQLKRVVESLSALK
jgi:hypothetical protein